MSMVLRMLNNKGHRHRLRLEALPHARPPSPKHKIIFQCQTALNCGKWISYPFSWGKMPSGKCKPNFSVLILMWVKLVGTYGTMNFWHAIFTSAICHHIPSQFLQIWPLGFVLRCLRCHNPGLKTTLKISIFRPGPTNKAALPTTC